MVVAFIMLNISIKFYMMQLSSEHLIEQFKFNTFFKNKFLSKIYKEEY
jgi:hypothetical protein